MKITKVLYRNMIPDFLPSNNVATCFNGKGDTVDIHIVGSIVYLKTPTNLYKYRLTDLGDYLLNNKIKIDRLSKINKILYENN